jgi:hypothetical protein
VRICAVGWLPKPWTRQLVTTELIRLFITDLELLIYTINIRGCNQKFPDWVDNEINNNNKHLLRSNNTKGYGGKLTRMTHKIAIQLHLVAESWTICSSHSRRPVRKLLDTPSHMSRWNSLLTCLVYRLWTLAFWKITSIVHIRRFSQPLKAHNTVIFIKNNGN